MRLGIFGGTFNPIHYGHLINNEIVRGEYSLDKILFIPARMPVHKDLDGMISGDDRLKMVELAISDNKGFDVSPIELVRNSPSYTIITIKDIIRIYPDSKIFLIIGADSFNEIDKWKDYEKILEMVHLIVMGRKSDIDYRDDIIEKSNNLLFPGNPIIEISSSTIRKKLRNNQSVKYLLPDNVIQFIKKKGLYNN